MSADNDNGFMIPATFFGPEHLTTAVVLLDRNFCVRYVNPAAENMFKFSAKHVVGVPLPQAFLDTEILSRAVDFAQTHHTCFTEHEITLPDASGHALTVSCTVTPVELEEVALILEFHQIDKQLKIAREERMLLQQQSNRELLRNLAHEIKNPLGGLRGAAQLLERELPRANLREYTQVIIKEADRLQSLLERLLTPHQLPQLRSVNVHEVLERVRSLTLAETPSGIVIRRDYDTSLPDLLADPEQLIQAVLNIVRNAVQAMQGKGEIILRTRIARQVTVVKKRYRLALMVQIIDNGPGIPEAIRERIFYPLVSGREGGSGMGLTLAQTLINQHQGTIECDSQPGYTCFTLLLPIVNGGNQHASRLDS